MNFSYKNQCLTQKYESNIKIDIKNNFEDKNYPNIAIQIMKRDESGKLIYDYLLKSKQWYINNLVKFESFKSKNEKTSIDNNPRNNELQVFITGKVIFSHIFLAEYYKNEHIHFNSNKSEKIMNTYLRKVIFNFKALHIPILIYEINETVAKNIFQISSEKKHSLYILLWIHENKELPEIKKYIIYRQKTTKK